MDSLNVSYLAFKKFNEGQSDVQCNYFQYPSLSLSRWFRPQHCPYTQTINDKGVLTAGEIVFLSALNENGPLLARRFLHLVPGNRAVWEELGGMVWLEEVCPWLRKPHNIPFPVCGYLYFVLIDHNVGSQLTLQHSPCLSAAMLPIMIVMELSGTVGPK